MWMWIDCLPSPKMLNLWERARRNGGFPLKKFRITWVRYLPSKPRWKWISTHLWWEKHRKLAGAAQLSGHIRPLECTVINYINYSDTCMYACTFDLIHMCIYTTPKSGIIICPGMFLFGLLFLKPTNRFCPVACLRTERKKLLAQGWF